jgi:hypothetical protein
MRQIINIAKTFFIFSFIVFLVIDICYGQNVVEVLRVREGIKISSITTPINVNASTVTVSNFPSKYNVSGSTIIVSNFPAVQSVSQSGIWEIQKATVVVENPLTNVSVNNIPSDYYKGQNITVAVSSGNINANVSGSVSVSNFPSSYDVSNSTVVIKQASGDVLISSGVVRLDSNVYNRVAITNVGTARDLAINTYNGIDVRLLNNTGTLISDTAPLPVNYSVMLSSYVETNVTSGTIKGTSTYLKGVVVGTAGTNSQLIILNGTNTVATIDTTAIRSIDLGIICGSGLSITTTGDTSAKITIIYR